MNVDELLGGRGALELRTVSLHFHLLRKGDIVGDLKSGIPV